MISPAFAQILKSGRAHFNQQFAAARRAQPGLDGDAFLGFLEEAVDPLVQAVGQAQPDRAADVATTAYDLALELAGQRILGRGEPGLTVADVWKRLLPAVPALVAANPARMLGATTNAWHALTITAGARPGPWLALMEKLGPAGADADAWLRLGQVAAWRSGLAHFRASALALAETLPEAARREIVGVPVGTRWEEARERLRADPWFDPAASGNGMHAGARVVAQVGAFRGFGGLFPEPPAVVASGDHFFVKSGGEAWMLTADAFGATFHRAKPEEHGALPVRRELSGRWRADGGRIEWNGAGVAVPGLGELTSVAATTTTVALTSRTTHRVVLLAWPQR